MSQATKPGRGGRLAAVVPFLLLAAVCILVTGPFAAPPPAEPPGLLLALQATPAPGSADSPEDESAEAPPRRRIRGSRIALWRTIEVPKDLILDGDVICIFGDVRIEGEVTKSVVVVGGSLRLDGEIRRDVVAVLTDTVLESGSRVGGDFNSIVGSLEDRGADVRRGYVEIPFDLSIPGMGRPFSLLASLLLWSRALSLALFFIFLLVLVALVPDRILTLSEETPVRYFGAVIAGLGGYVAYFVLCFVLVVTVIGLPAVPFLWLLFILLKWVGRAGILHLIGQRLGRQFGSEMSLPGAVFLGLVPYMLLLTVPLVLGGAAGVFAHVALSFVFWLLIDVPAVGLILLTRAGGRSRALAPKPTGPPAGGGGAAVSGGGVAGPA